MCSNFMHFCQILRPTCPSIKPLDHSGTGKSAPNFTEILGAIKMNNQKEIYEALLAGETLIHLAGETLIHKSETRLRLTRGELYNITTGQVESWTFKYPADWCIDRNPKWYESIPKGGVLCYCGGADWVKSSSLRIVLSYDVESEFPFRVEGDGWRDATPLTKQEVQVFLNNAPE